MNMVIMSDNHRDEDVVREVLRQNPSADRYYMLGDSEMRKHTLVDLGVVSVKGNYPFEPNVPKEIILSVEGVRILMAHGHKYHVKRGIEMIRRHAVEEACDLVFFGHTHMHRIYDAGDMLLVNPGSLSLPRGHTERTYARIAINNRDVRVDIINVVDEHVVNSFEKRLGEHHG